MRSRSAVLDGDAKHSGLFPPLPKLWEDIVSLGTDMTSVAYAYMCMYAYICAYIYNIYIYVYMYICIYVYMYICIYVYMYIHVNMYI